MTRALDLLGRALFWAANAAHEAGAYGVSEWLYGGSLALRKKAAER